MATGLKKTKIASYSADAKKTLDTQVGLKKSKNGKVSTEEFLNKEIIFQDNGFR